ncbi:hypothetical protein NM208_g8272 [Fusarium decemcellulare]|uniref:Uncharacterized protein n=1 Tax=Fusarium decemcellulare TaxID=57161 RepID=A0ACC1S691_9HYPO|nr:hypothetical protein NM208_g8272 [Fusarium decemcellulare]
MEAFKKAGFTQQEMIALVACGHTLGGVHSTENPGIAGGKPSPSNKPKFDSTSDQFDNVVVKEYFAGHGVNPLVFGRSETTNSDKRIFRSDGNATMTKLKDANTFQKTCARVFERLIDTVPSDVQLSEPIELVDVKPYIDKLEPASIPSRIAMEGKIRVRTSKSTGRDADTLQVSLNVRSRNGKRSKIQATRMVGGGQSFGFFNEVFTWYQFATEFDASAGVRSFDIHLKSDDGKELVLNNQGTGGFPLQDGLVVIRSKTCQGSTVQNGNLTMTIEAAVRNDLVDKTKAPVVQMAHKISQPGAILPRISIQPSQMAKMMNSRAPNYTHYTAKIGISAEEATTTFDIQYGSIKSEFHWTNRFSSC